MYKRLFPPEDASFLQSLFPPELANLFPPELLSSGALPTEAASLLKVIANPSSSGDSDGGDKQSGVTQSEAFWSASEKLKKTFEKQLNSF